MIELLFFLIKLVLSVALMGISLGILIFIFFSILKKILRGF